MFARAQLSALERTNLLKARARARAREAIRMLNMHAYKLLARCVRETMGIVSTARRLLIVLPENLPAITAIPVYERSPVNADIP